MEEDIYKHDFIGRKDFVNKLLNIIKGVSSERSWSFAINGKWGTGKSFVFDLLSKELKKENGIVCMEYNAWKNDFYDDPLISILFSILDFFESVNGEEWDRIQKLKNIIDMAKYSLSYIPGFKNIDKKAGFLKGMSERWHKKREKETDKKEFNEYASYSDLIIATQNFIKENIGNNKLVVLVDEIDRCTPEYAMKVLERMHYIFNDKNIIVIVNVNKDQLEKVLKDRYIDSEKDSYLQKFFDRTFDLPASNKKNYEKRMCETFIQEMNVIYDKNNYHLFVEILSNELGNLTERDVYKRFELFKFATSNINESERYLLIVLVLCVCVNKMLTGTAFYSKLVRNHILQGDSIIDFYYKNDFLSSETYEYIKPKRVATNTRPRGIKITEFTNKEIEKLFYLINVFVRSKDSEIVKNAFDYYKIEEFEFDEAQKLTTILMKCFDILKLI